MDNGHIVIVDDDVFIVNLLQEILSVNNFRIVPFQSPSPVLEYALDNPPDLFLLDINMPGIDGLELCRMIKGKGELENIPVIFISGALEGREKVQGFDAGGSDYITKPFLAKDVISRVRTHVKLKKSMDEILDFNNRLAREIQNRTRELQLEKENAEKANAAKSLFLSQINHELRTPLNGILGMLSLLGKKGSDEEQNDLYLSLAEYSAKHLSFLINNMLDYTQLESRSMSFYYRTLAVEDMFLNLEVLFRAKCEEKGIKMEIVHPEKREPFTGDQDRILQILNNIVTNAVKFSDRGMIRVIYECSGGLTVSVADEGPGIPEEIGKEIFKPFVKHRERYVKDQSGLGLGLAIAQSLASAMEGHIEFSSGDRGTVFTFHIPSHDNNTPQEWITSAEGGGIRPLSVLIVEDDAVSLYYLEKILEGYGCRVDQVINGTEALTALVEQSYDLVLMDIGLPRKSGLQVLEDIRSVKTDFRIPVIAVTAFSQKDDVALFYGKGFSDILVKPVSEDGLIGMIKKHLPGNRPPLP